uniref:Gustatory receptor n=1 Tax=Parascaris univalens TaxID=6257 RepID=A0A915ARF8_PARUN
MPYSERYNTDSGWPVLVTQVDRQSATLSARKAGFARQLSSNTRTSLLSDSRPYHMSPLQRHPTNGYRRYSICTFPRSFDYGTRSTPYRNRSANWRSFEKPTSVESSSFTGVSCELLPTDEKCNGGVRFDSSADTEVKHKSSSAVRVIRRRQSGYGIAISSDSTAKMRCRMRKQLFIKRNRVCDLSLALALAGLIFVVVDAELTALSSDTNITKRHPISLLLRSLCVISTLALMASLVNYHAIEVKIALIDSGADDWRVALTTERLIKLAIELLICSICPLPGTGMMSWPFIHPENRKVTMVDVPVDVILSVPMFLRSYLLCRFMVLHSKQFQDAATRSIAALNRISMDFRFVIKTMMADHPLRVLIVFTVSYWVCMSWMFTQCERYDGRVPAEHYYLNSMWFIMVMAILYQILIVVEHFQ